MNSCGGVPGRINNVSATLPRRITSGVGTLLARCGKGRRGAFRSVLSFRIGFREVRPFRSKGNHMNELVVFGRYLGCGVIPFVVRSGLGVFCCHKLGR